MERRRRGSLAAGAIVVLTLGACSTEDLTERVIENRIETETGENVDLDLDGGNIRVETDEGTFEMSADEDGNMSIQAEGADGEFSMNSEDGVTIIESEDGDATITQGSGELPDGFPSDVPLPEGFTPEFSQTMTTSEGDTWVLGGEMAGDPGAIGDDLIARLEAAGFEQQAVNRSPDGVVLVYDDGEHLVSGGTGRGSEDGRTFVNLTVGPSSL